MIELSAITKLALTLVPHRPNVGASRERGAFGAGKLAEAFIGPLTPRSSPFFILMEELVLMDTF